jgi:hypothetical protein
MRLIDADHLRRWILSRVFKTQLSVADIIDQIDREDPIEPERKKGKWVGYDGDWLKTMCKCSECGAMIDINEKYRNFFCYHCGARMEGE